MKRLASIDALRGFDMSFIMGGEQLVVAVAALLGFADFGKVFGHVAWHGLQFMDCVFPTFLFIAGISFPFSAAKSREKGMSDWQIARKCFIRFILLALLGFQHDSGFLGLNFSQDLAHVRVWSVLGRIGFAWMMASFLYLLFNTKARIAIGAGILVAVTLFTRFVIAPDAPVGTDPFSAEGNIGCWLDRTLTGGHLYRDAWSWKKGLQIFDPEGFAGHIPAIVTAMLGMFAGEIVRKAEWSLERKAGLLAGMGAGLLAVGYAWSFVFPINKALWSPSFVLVVGGISSLAFALFFWIIDVKGKVAWSFPFRVIGMNSILIYMLQVVVPMDRVNKALFGGFASLMPNVYGEAFLWATYMFVCWYFLYVCYRKQLFLKV